MKSIAALLAMALSTMHARPVPIPMAEGQGQLSIASARIATLVPLSPDEVRRILTLPVRKWLGPIGRRRGGLSFSATGGAVDGNCDPAACEGRYVISGNRVSIDWHGRRGQMVIHFYMAANGLVYEATNEDIRKGVAVPW